jgi:hypothetical protein
MSRRPRLPLAFVLGRDRRAHPPDAVQMVETIQSTGSTVHSLTCPQFHNLEQTVGEIRPFRISARKRVGTLPATPKQ